MIFRQESVKSDRKVLRPVFLKVTIFLIAKYHVFEHNFVGGGPKTAFFPKTGKIQNRKTRSPRPR